MSPVEQPMTHAEKRAWLIELISEWEKDYYSALDKLLTMTENDEGWTNLLNSMLRAKSNVDSFTAMMNQIDEPG